MRKAVYYFSGSGHSYLAARDLAGKINAELISVKKAVKSIPDLTGTDMIGLVFPVYHASFGMSGIPFLVERFVNMFDSLEGKYIFAVCTHGGKPGQVLKKLEEMLASKGGKLSYGSCVRLSAPYRMDERIRSAFLKTPLNERLKEEAAAAFRYPEWQALLPKMAVRINNRKSCVMSEGYDSGFLKPVNKVLQRKMSEAWYRALSETDAGTMKMLINLSDSGFRITQSCTGCGLCARLCPVGNIVLKDGQPRRTGRCENCFACYHWCPQQAVAGPLVEYMNKITAPGVSAEELL